MTYPGSLVKKQKYTYDPADRIKEVVYSNDATIDAFDRKVTYDYDGVGNRLSQKIEENGVTIKDLRSSYGSENRLLAVTDQVTGNEVARYVYDAAGNRVQKVAAEGTTFYSYDERNLLTSLLTPQTYVSYEYNGSAHRIARTEGGIRNAYVVDPNRSVFEVIQERDSAGVIQKSYTFGLDRLWMQPTPGTVKYYLADRLGSVRQTVDANTIILETFDYDVFGAVRE